LNVAACMTRELAESGSGFVITIINECDLVPCFSSGSLDDLRAEVGNCYYIISNFWLDLTKFEWIHDLLIWIGFKYTKNLWFKLVFNALKT